MFHMEHSKEACLARWRANAKKRTAYAQQIIDGRRKMNPNLEQWKKYDIQAEINLLTREREHAQNEARLRRKKYRQE